MPPNTEAQQFRIWLTKQNPKLFGGHIAPEAPILQMSPGNKMYMRFRDFIGRPIPPTARPVRPKIPITMAPAPTARPGVPTTMAPAFGPQPVTPTARPIPPLPGQVQLDIPPGGAITPEQALAQASRQGITPASGFADFLAFTGGHGLSAAETGFETAGMAARRKFRQLKEDPWKVVASPAWDVADVVKAVRSDESLGDQFRRARGEYRGLPWYEKAGFETVGTLPLALAAPSAQVVRAGLKAGAQGLAARGSLQAGLPAAASMAGELGLRTIATGLAPVAAAEVVIAAPFRGIGKLIRHLKQRNLLVDAPSRALPAGRRQLALGTGKPQEILSRPLGGDVQRFPKRKVIEGIIVSEDNPMGQHIALKDTPLVRQVLNSLRSRYSRKKYDPKGKIKDPVTMPTIEGVGHVQILPSNASKTQIDSALRQIRQLERSTSLKASMRRATQPPGTPAARAVGDIAEEVIPTPTTTGPTGPVEAELRGLPPELRQGVLGAEPVTPGRRPFTRPVSQREIAEATRGRVVDRPVYPPQEPASFWRTPIPGRPGAVPGGREGLVSPEQFAARDAAREAQEVEVAVKRLRDMPAEVIAPRKEGQGLGDNMGTPPPTRPEVALGDALDFPSWESSATTIPRKYHSARNVVGQEMQTFVEDGRKKLARLKLKVTQEDMEPIFLHLHEPDQYPRSTLSLGQATVVDDVRALMGQETADMLAFLQGADPRDLFLVGIDAKNFANRMMAHPDYFPRGWKQQIKPLLSGRPGTTPGFMKPRIDATYSELRQAGFEPTLWDPYHMVALRRVAGVDYRESTIWVTRARARGLAKPVGELLPSDKRFRVPSAGPVFEGRSVPDPDVPGASRMTEKIAMHSDLAGEAEQLWGKSISVDIGIPIPFTSRIVDRDLYRDFRAWGSAAKHVKLFGSLFQHVDFGARMTFYHFTPTVLAKGGILDAPALLTRLIRANLSAGYRGELRKELLSGKPLYKDSDISFRMVMEEGLGIGGDISMFKREILGALSDVGGGQSLPVRAARNLKKVQQFMESGLFDGVYTVAHMDALQKFIIPRIRSDHPNFTSREVAAQAAYESNKMFSTLGTWQSVLKGRALREFMHTLIFSTNESEALIQQALGALPASWGRALKRRPPGTPRIEGVQNQRLWREYYLGFFTSLAFFGNLINFAATGKPLPAQSYIPVKWNDPYAFWLYKKLGVPIGYNNRFLSPQVPLLKGRGGSPVYLDTVGQMDTAFRWILNPPEAAAARTNVLPRGITNQATGTTFFGEPLGTPLRRISQAAVDIAAPISVTHALGPLRDVIPGGERVLAEGESRLGTIPQLLKATGFNIRAEPTGLMLDRATENSDFVSAKTGEKITKYKELEKWQQTLLFKDPALRAEAALRRKTGVLREQEGNEYYHKKGKIDADRLQEELGLVKDPRGTRAALGFNSRASDEAVYARIRDRYQIRIAQLMESEGRIKEAEPPTDSDPNERARQEYYYFINAASGGKYVKDTVDWDYVDRQIAVAGWTPEQVSYVARNTSLQLHPVGLRALNITNLTVKPGFWISHNLVQQIQDEYATEE